MGGRVDHDRPALIASHAAPEGPAVRRASLPRALPAGSLAALTVVPVVFLGVFFVWPVTALVARGISAAGLREALTDPGVRSVARFTLLQASASTALTLALGLLPAYVLARYQFRGRGVVRALVTVPFVLPTVVVGAAFLALLPEGLHGSVWAILLAHVFFNLAVVVRTVGGLWAHLDPGLEDAARTLGAGPWRVFRHVTLPLLRPAIVAAASIVFLFTFTSFGVVLVLGGRRTSTLEVEVYRRFVQLGDVEGAAAIALVQLLALVVLLVWWGRSQERHARALRLRPGGTGARPRTARQHALVWGTVVAVLAAVLAPLARMVERSFALGDGHGLAAWRALARAGQRGLGTEAPILSLGASLRFAVATAVLAVVIGGAAACSIGYTRRGGRLLDAGLMLPLGASAVTVGFGLVITMDTPPLDLRGSPVLIPIGHALVAVPFVVRVVLPVLRSIDPRLRDAAATLGASPWRAWREVDVPLLARSLTVGAAFAFAVSMGEFGATSFLTRRGQETMPITIERLLGRPGALPAAQAYALATVLLGATVIAVLAVEHLRRDEAMF
jgi:thiamine transport system permease protein